MPRSTIEPPFLTSGAAQPVLVHNPVDQYLQTLLITTSYYSGQITPSLTLVYDWGGAFVAQPQVTFSRDPFRFNFSYSYLTADHLFGGSRRQPAARPRQRALPDRIRDLNDRSRRIPAGGSHGGDPPAF